MCIYYYLSTIDTGESDRDGVHAVTRSTGNALELAALRMQVVGELDKHRRDRSVIGDLGTQLHSSRSISSRYQGESMLRPFLSKIERQATEGVRSTEGDGTARVECQEQRDERRSGCGRVSYTRGRFAVDL